MSGELPDVAAELETLESATGRAQSDGPFDFQTVPTEMKGHNLVTARTNRT